MPILIFRPVQIIMTHPLQSTLQNYQDEKREKNDSFVSSPTLAFRLPVVENDNT